MRYTQGELAHARARSRAPSTLAHETGDMVMVARAENLLGDIEHSVGNVDAAREHFARGVEGFRRWRFRGGSGIR